MSKIIALDFDGTLHPYDEGWCGSAPTDVPPIPGTKQALQALIDEGFKLVIFSCRADHQAGVDGIWEWLRKYKLDDLIINVVSDKPKATAYIDDRAVPFAPRSFESATLAWDSAVERVKQIAAHTGHGSAQ